VFDRSGELLALRIAGPASTSPWSESVRSAGLCWWS